MVRLGALFSNIGNKVKNFGLKVGSTFNKIAPKALHYGRLVAGGLSKLPGVIGTAAGFIHKGMDYADRVINSLPDSQLKSKLQTLEKGGSDFVNKVESKANSLGQMGATAGANANNVLNALSNSRPII